MSQLENDIIIDYPLLGGTACSIKYNISYNKVMWISEKYKLRVNSDARLLIHKNSITKRKIKKTIHSVNEEIFMKNFTKESVYLLGFIWGDGYIRNVGRNFQICIECVSDDIIALNEVFEKTGKWTFNKRLRVNKIREVTVVSTSNKELVNFLVENDYKDKSKKTPEKIFNLIPDELKAFFILGWIDADGCFYWNEKHKLRQFYLSGSYEQNWSIFESVLKDLCVDYKIVRVINIKSQYSNIRVTGRTNIFKIGEYIYNKNIYLKRKYDKYELIISQLH